MEEPVWNEWRRPGPTPAQQRRDIGIAVLVLLCAVEFTVLVNSIGAFAQGRAPDLREQLAWVLALSVPLVVRRRYPLAVMLVVSALFIAAQWRQLGDNLVPSGILFLAIFTVGAWEQNRLVARWSRIGVIATMFFWLGFSLVRALLGPPGNFKNAAGPLDPTLATVVYGLEFNIFFFVFAYVVGEMAWTAARRQAELSFQAEELRLSQEQNTRGAIAAERMRIARDLHDVVAHHVSVMGIQAGAARRVLDSDPAMARDTLQTVEETARTAISELRGLLGVLRADAEPDLRAAPGLDDLPELLENARAAGLEVTHGVYGAPREVPSAVALSAYRVVQEALTNVVKHAAAQHVDVRMRYLDNTLEVEITDDGRGPSTAPVPGFGLVGMRERLAVHGGSLETGPRRDAGYLVRASLPTGEKP
ncbi:sensor histidine kinase [Lentzea nigeriaca]|uniref:sensor histidine kinase n=1 Tax=Lentzea nigeriaca TaxID=1128665 RepID=UPI0027DB030E|nr:sensor histidine kinase [Lentzea nigeriaca]MBM7859058.1 signal transduction histidine kinase [Lentzea nigeriaca]